MLTEPSGGSGSGRSIISDGVTGVVAVAGVSLVSGCDTTPTVASECHLPPQHSTTLLKTLQCSITLLHHHHSNNKDAEEAGEDVSDVFSASPVYSPESGEQGGGVSRFNYHLDIKYFLMCSIRVTCLFYL